MIGVQVVLQGALAGAFRIFRRLRGRLHCLLPSRVDGARAAQSARESVADAQTQASLAPREQAVPDYPKPRSAKFRTEWRRWGSISNHLLGSHGISHL